VILVYRPSTVLFVLFVLVRSFAAAEPTEIVRIVVISEPEGLDVLLTAWHTSPLLRSCHRAESRQRRRRPKLHFACLVRVALYNGVRPYVSEYNAHDTPSRPSVDELDRHRLRDDS